MRERQRNRERCTVKSEDIGRRYKCRERWGGEIMMQGGKPDW